MKKLLTLLLAISGVLLLAKGTVAAVTLSDQHQKIDPTIYLWLGPDGTKGIKGYIDMATPGVSYKPSYCAGKVRISYSSAGKIVLQDIKWSYVHSPRFHQGNGYCGVAVNKKLAAGNWSITGSFTGNSHLNPTSSARTISLQSKRKVTSANAGPPSIRVVSYNVLGSIHTEPDGDQPQRQRWEPRIKLAANIIKRYGLDIVGLQELYQPQRNELADLIGNYYDIYPGEPNYDDQSSYTSIMWRKSKFKATATGKTNIYYFDGAEIKTPWVKLQDKRTGKQFYVFNAHYPTSSGHNNDGRNSKIYREKDAYIQLAEAEARLKSGLPVILTGDFNSSFIVRKGDFPDRNRLVYCIFTANGDFRHAYDVRHGKTGQCPTQSGGGIDHIYVSNQFSVTAWGRLNNADTKAASDHNPAVAIMKLDQ